MHFLVSKQTQVVTDNTTSITGFNDIIDKTTLSCHHWIRESISVFSCIFLDILLSYITTDANRHSARASVDLKQHNMLCLTYLSAEDDLDCSFRAHHCNLGPRPSVICISFQVFGSHDIICSSVGFSRYDCDLRHGRLSICE